MPAPLPLPHVTPTLTLDGYVRELIINSPHPAVEILVVHVMNDCEKWIAKGDILVVEACGGCESCTPRTPLLIKRNGVFRIESKGERKFRPFHVVGGDTTEVIGRIIGWVPGS